MGTISIARKVKAAWGFPCNQSVDGKLWAGKGYALTLAEQLGAHIAEPAAVVLRRERGFRMGHFWIDLKKRILTTMIGSSEENKYMQVPF